MHPVKLFFMIWEYSTDPVGGMDELLIHLSLSNIIGPHILVPHNIAQFSRCFKSNFQVIESS